MKAIINKKYVVIGITLAIGLTIGWLIKPTKEQIGDSSNHPIINKSKDQIWTCSMHPQIKKKEPGNCPICGMTLVPLEENNDAIDPKAVRMSPTAIQLAQVQTLIVGHKRAEKSIQLNGKVQPDERRMVTQASHVPGRIEKLTVNFTGEFVRKGQVIAYIYSPALVTAQEELFEALKIKESQPQLFEAAKEKLKHWKITDTQIEQIITAKQPMEQFPILANVSGYVTEKRVNLGDYIKQGAPIYEIADLSNVWVLFEVYESEMRWIKKGMSVTYTVQSLPGKTFTGTIHYIDPVIDAKTRIAQARVEASNPQLLLKPGMFVKGTVQAKANITAPPITIPKTAVLWTGKRSVVYVMQHTAQGISFRMREVTLGPELGESYVIESGLQQGEEIAVHGTFSIDAAAQLAGKPSMMNPEGGVGTAGHNHGEMNRADISSTSHAPVQEIKDITMSTAAKEALQPLYREYFKCKEALTADDFEQAKQAGSDLKEEIKNVDTAVFTGNSRTIWMQYAISLQKVLQHIQHHKTIEELRHTFQQVSEIMIALTQAFHLTEETLYIQYCPMANNAKGASWLSAEQEIRNPYFGAAMLRCGEIIEVVKEV